MTDLEGRHVGMTEARLRAAAFSWKLVETDSSRRVHAIGHDGKKHVSVECDLEMPELIQVAVRAKNVRDFMERIRGRCEW